MLLKFLVAIFLTVNLIVFIPKDSLAQLATVQGTISSIFAGQDDWYGVRFFLKDRVVDTTEGVCEADFIYTEPEPNSGHANKVAIFTMAYMLKKQVNWTVQEGRGGYCKLVEGRTVD